MPTRHYLRLLLRATLLTLPLLLLSIDGVDEPLARFVHEHGALLKPFFAGVMWVSEALQQLLFYHGLPVGWLALLLLFLVLRLLRRPHSTVWLVTLLTLVGSEAATKLLKPYFNRPRPLEVLSGMAPDAGFWQTAGRFDAFPSGHTAWVAGLLLPLALRFPPARPWLLGFVGLVAAGRVALEMHWLSDVVAAVYVALVLTCVFEVLTGWLRPAPPSPLSRREGELETSSNFSPFHE
ncbi:phosphatase PAP2 family protein [Hymenobacter weizhouensis]|uniref:phosphatase PAP2 family protein n=1 Tax=Hymenobacter sp. YIM 151500-1 TaxID=2987689 RepID=UPI002227AF94|nr:phosphatase PAP2 family protein [Hymenobacter sp. YIM 151500-1]UYZ65064.1 phosphatase PAP2 family protein [Hymenobacter sp. YIM 151500-1]